MNNEGAETDPAPTVPAPVSTKFTPMAQAYREMWCEKRAIEIRAMEALRRRALFSSNLRP